MSDSLRTFDVIKTALLAELEIHRNEIQLGELNWFSMKVILNRGKIQATWQSESNCRIADDEAWDILMRR